MTIFEHIMNFVGTFFPTSGYENTIKFLSLGMGIALLIGFLSVLRNIFRAFTR